MIMEIFLLFVGIGFLLTIVGYYVNENLLIIIGFLIFGLISIPLLQQNLEYRVGSNLTVEYNYSAGVLATSTNSISYDYNSYTDTIWYGIFFMLLSLSGMFMWYKGYGGRKSEVDD